MQFLGFVMEKKLLVFPYSMWPSNFVSLLWLGPTTACHKVRLFLLCLTAEFLRLESFHQAQKGAQSCHRAAGGTGHSPGTSLAHVRWVGGDGGQAASLASWQQPASQACVPTQTFLNNPAGSILCHLCFCLLHVEGQSTGHCKHSASLSATSL